jgi:hypothetical protein
MLKRRKRLSFLIVGLVCYFSLFAGASGTQSVRLPLTFEPNQGQADAQTLFLARTPSGTVLLTHDGALLNSATEGSPHSVRLRFHGLKNAHPLAEGATGGLVNYYHSQNRNQWLTHIPLYSSVRYPEISKGIDVLFHGRDGQLEYDFEIVPGASPRDINFTLQGADKISISTDGGLDFAAGDQRWRLLPPRAYQSHAGQQMAVPSAYRIQVDGSVAFTVGDYDKSLLLTIDPVVQY